MARQVRVFEDSKCQAIKRQCKQSKNGNCVVSSTAQTAESSDKL